MVATEMRLKQIFGRMSFNGFIGDGITTVVEGALAAVVAGNILVEVSTVLE